MEYVENSGTSRIQIRKNEVRIRARKRRGTTNIFPPLGKNGVDHCTDYHGQIRSEVVWEGS